MPKQVKITPEVREVLALATVCGPAERPTVKLNQPGLERGLYVQVDKVLKALGGKWDRGAAGHTFPRPVEGELAEALQSGVAVDQARTMEQFFTPEPLAKQLVAMADVEGTDVLEPSAGSGELIDAARDAGAFTVQAVELDERLAASIASEYDGEVAISQADFLQWTPPNGDRYERVVMNPPFGRGADMAHVTRALGFLKPGGLLVAIMSPHWVQSVDRASNDFRVMLSQLGDDAYDWEPLPEGSFRQSGTSVNTGILTIRKG